MAGGVLQDLSLGQALPASVLSDHPSDELPNERGHAHGCPVRRHGRILVRRVSHEHLRALIGRVSQRPTGLAAAYSLRTHMNSVHLGLAVFTVFASAARGHISYRDQGDGGWYRMRSVRKFVVVAMVAMTRRVRGWRWNLRLRRLCNTPFSDIS